uniref:UPF0481 protein At3g47200 n=1 Tax=Anthurium amnicola TaxID=1678845 RepID=A0A1D1ZE80_9ARAE
MAGAVESVQEMDQLQTAVRADELETPINNQGEQQQSLLAGDAQVVVISMEDMLLQAKLDSLRHRFFPPTIRRVRPSVREEDPGAYDPRAVSLGPFHHGRDGLEAMEKLKSWFLNDLLRRSPHNSVKKYVDAVVKCADAKSQYPREIYEQTVEPEEFVEMMVLDGGFLVECLAKCWERSLDGALASASCSAALLRHDCLLLENQIPFCVLEAVFNESAMEWPRGLATIPPPTLWQLATHFLGITNLPWEPDFRVHHLLHLFHLSLDPELSPNPPLKSCFLVTRYLRNLTNLASLVFYGVLYFLMMCQWPRRSRSATRERYRVPMTIPSATELREAGIRIEKRRFEDEGVQGCFLKVGFEDGSLHIPFLSVDPSTNSRFRNLVAFEQLCCTDVGNYFTGYAAFMDNIVNTADDVAVLRSCGVMESKLGSDEEVAGMFNRVCRGAELHDEQYHYLTPVFRDVKKSSEYSRHRWRAKLVHEYFSSPWSLISVVVASLLLIFTGMQAVYAMVAYYRPPK